MRKCANGVIGILCLICFALLMAAPATASSGFDDPDLLVNSDFEQWEDGRPVGWTILLGATEGEGPESSVAPGEGRLPGGHSLALSGDHSTQRWHAAVQMFDVTPGEVFRLSGWLRSDDVTRDGHRYANSQAAVMAKSGDGQRINTWILGPATGTTQWSPHEVYFQAPLGSTRIEVMIFLSMSGTLECDDLSLKRFSVPRTDPDAPREERWLRDIEFLEELLPRLHVQPFTVTSEEAFRSQLTALKAAIGDLSDLEINLRLMALVASLGDAHTEIGLSEGPQYLPIQFGLFSDELRVLAVDRRCADLAGARVTRIGRYDLQECLGLVRPLIACETESRFRHQAPGFLRLAEVLHGLGITDSLGLATVTAIADDGLERSCIVALPEAGQQPEFEVCETTGETPLYLSNSANYWYHYLEEYRTFYLQYNRCLEDSQRPMAEFTSEVARFLDSHPVNRFVLDVRHNTGGGSQLLNALIKEVSERQSAGSISQCFVITGQATFSAAALNTLDFRKATGALVIGEPMGNKPNRFGQVNVLTLPNSGLRVQYATKRFVRMEGDPPVLAPDVPVELSWDDYLAGRDPALSYVLSLD